jgi:hypothetical protein
LKKRRHTPGLSELSQKKRIRRWYDEDLRYSNIFSVREISEIYPAETRGQGSAPDTGAFMVADICDDP